MKRWISLLLKVAISVGIIIWFVKKNKISTDIFDFTSFHWQWGTVVIGTAIAQVLLQALRWRTLYGADQVPPFKEFLKFIFIGYFFSIMLPWSLGGDAIKAVAFGKRHDGILHSSAAIFFGRFFGITSLFILFWLSYALFDYSLERKYLLVISILSIGIITALIVFLTTPKFFISRLAEDSRIRKVLESTSTLTRSRWISGALLSILIQLSMFTLIFAAFRMVGAELTYPMTLFYAPLTTLLLFLPISFAGIGVREASLSHFLTPFDGIVSHHCVQASMVNYVVLLAFAFVGAIYFIFYKKHTAVEE